MINRHNRPGGQKPILSPFLQPSSTILSKSRRKSGRNYLRKIEIDPPSPLDQGSAQRNDRILLLLSKKISLNTACYGDQEIGTPQLLIILHTDEGGEGRNSIRWFVRSAGLHVRSMGRGGGGGGEKMRRIKRPIMRIWLISAEQRLCNACLEGR